MSDTPTQIVLLDSPEAAARAASLFPASLCVYANGLLPPEARDMPDAITIGPDKDWRDNLCRQFAARECPKIRQIDGTIDHLTDPAEALEWARANLTPYVAEVPDFEPADLPEVDGPPVAAPSPTVATAPPFAGGDAGEGAESPESLEIERINDLLAGGYYDEHDAAETALRSIRNASVLKTAAHKSEWPDPADFWATKPLPAFDPDWILPCVRPFALNQAAMIGCDPGITWLQMIGFAAGCLDDAIRVRVRPSQDWAESARIWACVVGDSGDGKSPSMRAVVRESRDLSLEIAQRSKEKNAGYKDELELYELDRKAWLSKQQKGEPAGQRPVAPDKPVNELLYFSSTTAEGLLEQQEQSTRGTMCSVDEFLGWLLGMDQYKAGGKGSDRQFWLSSWDGAEFVGILVGRLRTIPNTGVSIIGGSQPHALRAAAQKLNLDQDGLLQRVLIYNSVGEAREDEEQYADRDAIARWKSILHRLYYMKTHLDHCVLESGAHEVRKEANEWISKMRSVSTIPAGARQALSKWRAYLPRIALTLHAIQSADAGREVIEPTIERDTVALAWAHMRDCLWPHLLHFYTMMADSDEESRAVKLFAEFVLARNITEVKPSWLGSNWTYYRRNLKTIHERREFWAQAESVGWVRRAGEIDRQAGIAARYVVNGKAFDGRFSEPQEAAILALELHRAAQHPAFLAAQSREPGQD